MKREAGMRTECLPGEETEYEICEKTKEVLEQNGYRQYEISNYAKAGYECRHNIGYWKRTDYLGMGLGAASLIDNVRYTNARDLFLYIEETSDIHAVSIEGVEHGMATNLHEQADVVSRNAQIEEYMFLGLRMTEGITRAEFRQTFGVEIEAVYAGILPKLAEEGLIRMEAGVIRLTKRGTDISNYVLAQFLLD